MKECIMLRINLSSIHWSIFCGKCDNYFKTDAISNFYNVSGV